MTTRQICNHCKGKRRKLHTKARPKCVIEKESYKIEINSSRVLRSVHNRSVKYTLENSVHTQQEQ